MTKTQLREIPYKRPQITYALESLLGNSRIREVNPTTKRLVERCLSGEWCVHLRRTTKDSNDTDSIDSRLGTPSTSSDQSHTSTQLGITSVSTPSHLTKPKTLRPSKSMEFTHNMTDPTSTPKAARESTRWRERDTPSPIASSPSLPLARPTRRGTANSAHVDGAFADRHHPHTLGHGENEPIIQEHIHTSSVNANKIPSSAKSTSSSTSTSSHRRSAPPPPKRRKPPAVPVNKNGEVTITPIRSSASPLSRS
jgi:hypothetical protein